MTPHGHFAWNELMTRDPERAKAFFGKTIGWTFDEMKMEGMPSYWVAMDGDQPVGGIFTMEGERFEGIPENWMSYLAVDDVDRRIKAIQEAGGKVMHDPFDIPNVGRIAVVADSGGAVLGIMTPARM